MCYRTGKYTVCMRKNECESRCVMLRQPCTSWQWVWKLLCYVEATLYKLTMSVKVTVLCWGNLVQADNECESHCVMLRQPCTSWQWVWKSAWCWGNLVQADNECESHCVMLRQPCTSWQWVWKSLYYVEVTLYNLGMSVTKITHQHRMTVKIHMTLEVKTKTLYYNYLNNLSENKRGILFETET